MKTQTPLVPKKNRPHKTALVMGGGGIAGGVYEIGCLKAIDSFLTNKSVNDFDMYVGTSVGSMITAALATGVPSNELFKSIIGKASSIENIDRGVCFKPNVRELIEKSMAAPAKTFFALRQYFSKDFDSTLLDLAYELIAEITPSGIFTSEGIENYVKKNFLKNKIKDDFHYIPKELYITSCNLDTGKRVVFGESGFRHIPVSTAVKASTAIPPLYRPVRIGHEDYVDGAVIRPLHLDVAIAHGATFIICINPIVPLFNTVQNKLLPLIGRKTGHISQKGLFTVLDQMLRTAIHTRIERGIEKVKRENPHVDILLFEPREDDLTMFSYSLMNYSSRVRIAEHGFISVRNEWMKNLHKYEKMLNKHGFNVSKAQIDSEYYSMKKKHFSVSAVENVLSS